MRQSETFRETGGRAHVLSQPPCNPEQERLFLPSDFSKAEREGFVLEELAQEEGILREGQMCDIILQLRNTVKQLMAIHRAKAKNSKGQQQNTWASGRIERARFICNYTLKNYTLARSAMEALGCLNEVYSTLRFPNLNFRVTLPQAYHAEERCRGHLPE